MTKRTSFREELVRNTVVAIVMLAALMVVMLVVSK